MVVDIRSVDRIQKEFFFAILDAFFTQATGHAYADFADIDDFGSTITQNIKLPTAAGFQAFSEVYDELQKFYARNSIALFSSSKLLGGMKLVLGGSRFTVTHFHSVRKMLLYADTILIPDPIMPWIESERKEEEFRDILFLENVFILLHLKPLVDATLPYPAVLVFPSFEKSLEEHDVATKNGISELVRTFLSHHIGVTTSSTDELVGYVKTHEENFLVSIDKTKLFIAPGGELSDSLPVSLAKYRAEQTKCTTSFATQVNSMTDGLFVLYGLFERLGLQYHLFENADELTAQPMLCIPAQWHYYNLCTQL